jgi:hypothetical protein
VLRWTCHDPTMIQSGLFPGTSAGMFLIGQSMYAMSIGTTQVNFDPKSQ